ncbi:GNAT family N-acetyltransferase [Leifsonia kafniensis]|uniref:GNAT family N-acetyltransferase n=1 Tax=Leifsonia kafniensis TaxID=475957 RepID=A0ABP7K5L8_9MICO
MQKSDGFTPVRVATPRDLEAIVSTVSSAFLTDPLWAPMFPEAERRAAQMTALWRLLAGSALRYPWTVVTDQVESAAVWLPPGSTELTDEESAGFEEFLMDLVGEAGAAAIVRLTEQFDAVRPEEPHYYLSLLATHDAHRGRGLGMNLLRENLSRIDALGAAAHLESSNPANDARYASVGFERSGEFVAETGAVVTTMWRPAR